MIKQIAFNNSDAQTLILNESVDQIIDDPDGDGYVDTQKIYGPAKDFDRLYEQTHLARMLSRYETP